MLKGIVKGTANVVTSPINLATHLDKVVPTAVNAFSDPVGNFWRGVNAVHNMSTEDKVAFATEVIEGALLTKGALPLGEEADAAAPVAASQSGDAVGTGAADAVAPVTEGGGPAGPVIFRPPPNATPEEIAQVRAYCEGCNQALNDGALSPVGRVSTTGALRAAASRAAAEERLAAIERGDPYLGQVGHVPDTTWTGNPQPWAWADLSARVNASLGGQAVQYPVGWQPTEFIFEVNP